MNSQLVELDLRTFEPPQPLMKTLEAVSTLPAITTLKVHTRYTNDKA